MKKRLLLLVIILVSMILIPGCGKADNAGNSFPSDESAPGSSDNKVFIDDSRKIYYIVNYGFYVDDVEELGKKIQEKIAEYDGYTENQNVSYNTTTKECRYATYTFRIPTKNLNNFLKYLDSCEGVSNSSIRANDITESYVSTTERIATLQARKEAYTKLLKEENLTRSDIIQIEQRIDEIDTELNTLNTTLNKYESLLEYSTVTISINHSNEYKEETWFSNYAEYLKDLGIGIVNIFMYLLPIALIPGIVFILIFVPKIKRRKQRKEQEEKLEIEE